MLYFKLPHIFMYVIVIIHLSYANQQDSVDEKIVSPNDVVSQVNSVNSKGHVLIFHNAGTRSHLMALNALAEGLVEHGNKVTSIIYAESKIANENYREILVEDK